MKNIKPIKPIDQRKQPTYKYPNGEILKGKIVDEVGVDGQITYGNEVCKVYKNLVQLIKWDDGREDFRFCYYYINFSNEKPFWIFGQFALSLSIEDFKVLLGKMKKKGWI